jgi:hypothetical protein
VERAELERTARRARRVVWAFRLIFYPFAALLALALLFGRSEADTSAQTLRGRTQAGRAVTLYLVDGRPASFYASAIVTCPKDRYVQRFIAREPAITLVFHDRTLTASEAWTYDYRNGWIGHGETRLRAQVEDDRATGTVTMVQRISGPGAPYTCESGPVTFSASAQR